MVTYAIIGFFVLVCVVLLFGHSRLMQLQAELRKAETNRKASASAENDVTYARARDSYNAAVRSFPTNLVAMLTGFEAAD